MARHWTSTSATALVMAAACTAALAQDTPTTEETAAPKAAVDLTCADIADLEDAHAAALVYYVAGYTDATRDAAEGATAPADNGMIGGLTLSAAAVIAACAETPDQLISDVIAAQGGSMGARDAETPPPADDSAPSEGATEPPADEPAEPAEEPAEEPAGDADAEGEAGATTAPQ